MTAGNIAFKTKATFFKHRGFSAIELMVAVAIIAIVTSAALPGFAQFVGNTQIRSATESIRNGIQLARAEAVKRNAGVQFTLENDTSWTIGCVTPVVNVCPAVIQSKPAKEGTAGNVKLVLAGNKTVAFTNLGTVTTTAGQLSQVDVDSKTLNETDSRNLRIVLGTGGSLKMCDPNITATTDARKC